MKLLRTLAARVPLLFVLAVGSMAASASRLAAAPGTVDLSVRNFELLQAVSGEPLVLGKLTVARVQVGLPAGVNLDANVRVEAGGKNWERTVLLAGPSVTITLKIEPPQEVKPIVAQVSVTPAGAVVDPNPADNSRTISYPTLQTTEKVVAFFLPVDWTPEDRSSYRYDSAFREYVQNSGDFLIGTYPLSADHVLVDYTMTPHMLNSFEQSLTDSQGKFNMRNALALYGSLSIAGRRLRPDASMVVGVLPPGWFRQHGQPGTLGLTLSSVKGIVTGQYGAKVPPIVAAHEIGHVYALDEDYDFAVSPSHPCEPILSPSYWALRDLELTYGARTNLCTFMSAASSDDAYWVDQRIYEYLLGKFAIGNGTSSAPLILAATLTYRVEQDGSPARTSANRHRFEPNEPVYVSVGGMALAAGSTLQSKLYRGDTLVRTVEPQTTTAGNRWYAFRLAAANTLREAAYRVDVYLDGGLIKSSAFEVKASQ
ncbi:MAG: hypothetical protein M1482_03240 [Chloroflexi bacterium]|nr:hypothetical protein [Chloroflexota bacterium]